MTLLQGESKWEIICTILLISVHFRSLETRAEANYHIAKLESLFYCEFNFLTYLIWDMWLQKRHQVSS